MGPCFTMTQFIIKNAMAQIELKKGVLKFYDPLFKLKCMYVGIGYFIQCILQNEEMPTFKIRGTHDSNVTWADENQLKKVLLRNHY